ncbi:unnamed protein product [Calypogeia fissa]
MFVPLPGFLRHATEGGDPTADEGHPSAELTGATEPQSFMLRVRAPGNRLRAGTADVGVLGKPVAGLGLVGLLTRCLGRLGGGFARLPNDEGPRKLRVKGFSYCQREWE